MMFRRSVFEELEQSAFDSAWLDWILHIQAATHGPLGYIPEALAAYRVHRGGMFSALDRVSQLEEDARFYRRLVDRLPEQRELIERCAAFRHAQLAIERLGVPFQACVVLADPRHEFRPYFNGRHARALPRREGHEVTELQALREAAAKLPTAVEDYGSGMPSAEGPQGCFLVVPASAWQWLDERPDLRDYLGQHSRLAWQDGWATVFELAPLAGAGGRGMGRDVRRVGVKALRPASSDLPAVYFEAPEEGALLPSHAVTVAGWVVGDGKPATALEFQSGDDLIWRAPVGGERADVAAAFPDADSRRPGFQTTLNVCHLPPGASVTAYGVFGTERVALAELTFADPGAGATG